MADIASKLDSWSTTVGSNSPAGTTIVGAGVDDNLRQIQAVVRELAASNTLSSATPDLSTVDETFITITGTTTITALGTLTAGIYKFLIFDGALTLTHNGTSLILPGSANITTAAGDVALVLSLGSGNWRCLNYMKLSGIGITQPITKSYSSAVQTITAAGTLTLAHSLGTIPLIVQAFLKNVTGEFGYVTDDLVAVSFGRADGAERGINCLPDATNLNIIFGTAANSISVLHKTTGAANAITNANWKVIFRAFA